MKREQERLVKVTSESELRPGMVVVTKPCLNCGGKHRRILLRQHSGTFRRVRTGEMHKTAWIAEPRPRCWLPDTEVFDAEGCIAEGRLYRVVDGLDLAKEAERDRELERVR